MVIKKLPDEIRQEEHKILRIMKSNALIICNRYELCDDCPLKVLNTDRPGRTCIMDLLDDVINCYE